MYIASITERGSSGEGFTVRLSDGSSFFVSSTFFERHGFAEGMVLEENEMDILEEEEQRVLALRKAGDLLSRAEQSSGGLFLKLKKKGFSDAVCRQAVDRVVELGLLDDERFATFWLESRLRQHPEGRNILYQGLLARGVAAESAKEALSRVVKEDVMLQAVLKAGSKLSRRYGSDEGKLRRALLRRGFSQGEIRYFFEHN